MDVTSYILGSQVVGILLDKIRRMERLCCCGANYKITK